MGRAKEGWQREGLGRSRNAQEREKQRRCSVSLGKQAPRPSSHQWTALGVQSPSCTRSLVSCSSRGQEPGGKIGVADMTWTSSCIWGQSVGAGVLTQHVCGADTGTRFPASLHCSCFPALSATLYFLFLFLLLKSLITFGLLCQRGFSPKGDCSALTREVGLWRPWGNN